MKHPLPWKLTHDDLTLSITDANGAQVIFGNVNREIEYDSPEVIQILLRAIEAVNPPVA